jgi:uncharacterized DUF497 family protein
MEFEWDEAKYRSNLAKHGISFVQAADLIRTGDFYQKKSSYESEERIMATGIIDDRYVTVIYTLRNAAVRITSARIARKQERNDYEKAKRKNRPFQ